MNVTNKSSHSNNSQSLMLPCLASTGSKIFAPTADQRFLAGTTEFLRTHFPVKLNQRRGNGSITLTEDELLHDLLKSDASIVGNRVFVLLARENQNYFGGFRLKLLSTILNVLQL